MSAQHPPLTCDQFKNILRKLGFQPRPQKSGTSHEDWVKTERGRFYKVTVDCPKAPFSQDLISSMAHQAGVTKKVIYDVHFGRHTPQEQVQKAAASNVRRFEARKQAHASNDEFWCVWDIQQDTEAFGGQLTYLTEADATTRAEALNLS
jgi:predicted RNA binding protein YcfA (HicA-like mRNA interferase family)